MWTIPYSPADLSSESELGSLGTAVHSGQRVKPGVVQKNLKILLGKKASVKVIVINILRPNLVQVTKEGVEHVI